MSKKQIVKLVLSLVGVASILLAVALGISYNFLPHALQLLPLPLLLVGIALLLILKTTGTSLDAKKYLDPEGEGAPGEEEDAAPGATEVDAGPAQPQTAAKAEPDKAPERGGSVAFAEDEISAETAQRPAANLPPKNAPVTVKRKPKNK